MIIGEITMVQLIKIIFSYFQSKMFKDVLKILLIFLKKKFLENICTKGGFWGNYTLIFLLFDQIYDSKNHLF